MRVSRGLCVILFLALLVACGRELSIPLPLATSTRAIVTQPPTLSPGPTSAPTRALAPTELLAGPAEVTGAVLSIAHAPIARIHLEPNEMGIATLLVPTDGANGQQFLPLIDMLSPCMTVTAKGMRTGNELTVEQLNIIKAQSAPLGDFPAIVTMDQAPVYDNPGLEPGIVGQLRKDTIVSLRGRCGDFYGIITVTGKRGWVDSASIALEEADALPIIPPDPGRGSDDSSAVIRAVIVSANGQRGEIRLRVEGALETFEVGTGLRILYDTGRQATLNDLVPGTQVLAEVYPGRVVTTILILPPHAQ